MTKFEDTGLCIGGVLDGRREATHVDMKNLTATRELKRATLFGPGEYRRDHYTRMLFTGDKITFSFWVLDGIDADEAMARLVKGYRPNESA